MPTQREIELFDAVCSYGDWADMRQIAEGSGKHDLSPHDRELLKRLVLAKMIETRMVETAGPRGAKRVYRMWRGDNG